MRPNKAESILRAVLLVLLVGGLLLPVAAQAQSPSWQFEAGAFVHSAAVSADGQSIVVGSRQGSVIRLDAAGKELWRYEAGGTVLGLGLSQDGSRVIVATESRQALLLDGDGKVLWQKDFDYVLQGAAISGDGTLIALIPDKTKQLWVFDGDGNPLWEATYTVIATAVAISADGQSVAVGSRDAYVQKYDRCRSAHLEAADEGRDPRPRHEPGRFLPGGRR